MLIAAAAFSLCGASFAQQFPNKPLRLIVSQGAGGASDLIARQVAKRLGDALGQPVTVDNKPGAEGIIGADAAAKSTPDGYTLLFSANTIMSMNPSLYKKLPYDPLKDFDPVSFLGVASYGVFVSHTVPANNLREFIAYAKANPGKLHYGAGGAASRIGTEMFNMAAGIKLTYVPYKTNPTALTGLMGGEVELMVLPVSASQQVKTGKVKMLAVHSPTRLPQLPDVPTLIEGGVPDYEFLVWTAIHVPAGTPKDRTAVLSAAMKKILAMPEVVQEGRAAGFELKYSTPEELNELLRVDVQRYAKVVKAMGMTPVD